MISLRERDWFNTPPLKTVMALLNDAGGEARLVGGVVRNALMGLPVTDFDIATTLTPQQVMERAAGAGIRAVPTGIDHGTVTLVVEGIAFEVTTLRIDVSTDGRRAEVAFTDDWKADAARRDFTINALYLDANGDVHDEVGGLVDLERRMIRFIGNASERIAEDHLRILRFFRFFAHFGEGRPDAEGLKACAAAKSAIRTLSAERVWAELRKMLSATDPGRALLWMRTTGVLTEVLPETEKWGIDAMGGLVRAEAAFGWSPDPLLRLAAIVPPDAARLAAMAERLRMSRSEARFFADFANQPSLADDLDPTAFARMLYRSGQQGAIARLRLMLASLRENKGETIEGLAAIHRLAGFLAQAEQWQAPVFPVKGADLLATGMVAGPAMGARLARLEDAWVESGFKLGRAELLALE